MTHFVVISSIDESFSFAEEHTIDKWEEALSHEENEV